MYHSRNQKIKISLFPAPSSDPTGDPPSPPPQWEVSPLVSYFGEVRSNVSLKNTNDLKVVSKLIHLFLHRHALPE